MSVSSFCFAQLHIFEFVSERFDHCVAKFLRWYFRPSLCCIEFGICITPFVILLFGDFAVSVFFGLFCPSGKLNSYLTDIEQQAQDLFLRLVKEYADRQGVTEQLKAENQLEWVGKMNNIRSRAVEIIDVELICV